MMNDKTNENRIVLSTIEDYIDDISAMRKTDRREMIADLFFPNRCPFCGEPINWTLLCCEECAKNAEWSRVMQQHDERSFEQLVYAASYEGSAKKAVLSLKYRRDLNSADIFSLALFSILCDIYGGSCDCFDLIVPVPMSRKKLRSRGYNQAELIAERLSLMSGVPYSKGMLVHSHKRKSQHNRGSDDRESSVRDEYMFGASEQPKGRILLVDDVITTGSTLGRCSDILLENGAEAVCAAACCST